MTLTSKTILRVNISLRFSICLLDNEELRKSFYDENYENVTQSVLLKAKRTSRRYAFGTVYYHSKGYDATIVKTIRVTRRDTYIHAAQFLI